MKRGIVVALCIVLVGGIIAGGAIARAGKRITTALTLRNAEPSAYEGEVRSKKRVCEGLRKVRVYHDENDNGIDSSDYLIGSDKTNLAGEYDVHGNQAPPGDTIIAYASRRKLRSGTVCKAGEVSAIALSG
jgi:hypothetical protein